MDTAGRKTTALSILFLLGGLFIASATMPSTCRAISYTDPGFKDQFDDGTYADRWTVSVSGQASVRESGTLLDVDMTSQPGMCAEAVISQKQSVVIPCMLNITVVLIP